MAIHDFDGDGRDDIFRRDRAARTCAVWPMDGLSIQAGAGVVQDIAGNPVNGDAAWIWGGAGDFDGDGKADLLWRHQTRGTLKIWFMDGKIIFQPAGCNGTAGTLINKDNIK